MKFFFLPFCLQKKDVERTIGIDTDYIETNDFNLEYQDKQFLVEVSIFKHIARISLPAFNVGHENLRKYQVESIFKETLFSIFY